MRASNVHGLKKPKLRSWTYPVRNREIPGGEYAEKVGIESSRRSLSQLFPIFGTPKLLEVQFPCRFDENVAKPSCLMKPHQGKNYRERSCRSFRQELYIFKKRSQEKFVRSFCSEDMGSIMNLIWGGFLQNATQIATQKENGLEKKSLSHCILWCRQ